MSKKRPDIFLIIAILTAGIIVAGALFYVQTQTNKNPLQPYSEQVLIPETMQACSENDQCIVIDTMCSFCCKYTAINARFEKMFNTLFDNNCQHYEGAMCECFDLGSYPSCINGKCQLVKWSNDKSE